MQALQFNFKFQYSQYSGAGKGRMVPCCYITLSHNMDTKCYHVIKFDQLNASLFLHHDTSGNSTKKITGREDSQLWK